MTEPRLREQEGMSNVTYIPKRACLPASTPWAEIIWYSLNHISSSLPPHTTTLCSVVLSMYIAPSAHKIKNTPSRFYCLCSFLYNYNIILRPGLNANASLFKYIVILSFFFQEKKFPLAFSFSFFLFLVKPKVPFTVLYQRR